MSPSDSLRMIGPLERALFLKTIEPLGEVSPESIAVFAENANERHFRAGEALLRPGQPVDRYFVIVDGAVRATGGEYLDGVDLGPRDSLGFLSMLGCRNCGVDAVATESTVALEFEQEVMYDILEDSFSLVHLLVRRLARLTLDVRRAVPDGSYLAPLEGVVQPPRDRPLDLVERILLVRRPGGPFEKAGLGAVTQLASALPELRFDEGVTLWKSGDRSDHALIVVSGTVKCVTQWDRSRFRAGPGYPLGNLERFSGHPRWFTATTETPLVAIRSDTESFLDLLEDHFDLTLGFLRSMAERVIDIRREAAGLAAEASA